MPIDTVDTGFTGPLSLDSLLKEALNHELNKRRGKGTVNRLAAIKSICHSLYTNPENWQATRTLSLVHVESGEVLGLFQEYVHKRTKARKLSRIQGDSSSACVERVSGPQWIGPYIHRVDPPTEGEIAHIRNMMRPKLWRPAWKKPREVTRTAEMMLKDLGI